MSRSRLSVSIPKDPRTCCRGFACMPSTGCGTRCFRTSGISPQLRVSLKEYFADPDVQVYLEELPNEPEVAPANWSLAQSQERAYAAAAQSGSRSPMPPAPMATVTTPRSPARGSSTADSC